jgi:hypothetical protein
MPSMAVKYSKKAHLGPLAFPIFGFRLENVQYYADSVFVILSDNPLVSVGRVSFHNPALFIAGLSYLVIFKLKGFRVQLYRVISEK